MFLKASYKACPPCPSLQEAAMMITPPSLQDASPAVIPFTD